MRANNLEEGHRRGAQQARHDSPRFIYLMNKYVPTVSSGPGTVLVAEATNVNPGMVSILCSIRMEDMDLNLMRAM